MNKSCDQSLGPFLLGDPYAQRVLHIALYRPWLGAIEIAP